MCRRTRPTVLTSWVLPFAGRYWGCTGTTTPSAAVSALMVIIARATPRLAAVVVLPVPPCVLSTGFEQKEHRFLSSLSMVLAHDF